MKLFYAAFLPVAVRGSHWSLRRHLEDDKYGELRSDWDPDGCIKVRHENPRDDQKLLFDECDRSKGLWRFDDHGLIHTSLDDSQCMQAGQNGPVKDGEYVRLYPCDASNELQQFRYGGGIYPKSDPDLCMVWQGVNGDIGVDYIIFKDCDALEIGRGFPSGDGFPDDNPS